MTLALTPRHRIRASTTSTNNVEHPSTDYNQSQYQLRGFNIRGELEFPHLDLFLEKAYELNIRLMRQNAGGIFRRYHNELLGNDFLAASLNEVRR